MLEVPVYLITGFLESGKTSFIREVLASPDFADGEKTLLILCEEGEEEYDEKEYSRHNIEIVKIEREEDLNPKFLETFHKFYKPYRVFVEFNGMWDAERFVNSGLPRRWEVVQIITLVDAETFEVYLTNMRSLLSNIFKETELVIFNRCSREMDLNKFRRTVKAVNQQAMLSFEDQDGNQLELSREQPPYDLKAKIIDVEDTDYGLLFLDLSESPERYRGRTIRFKGKVMIPRKFPEGCFIPGRNAMTCCANDIRFIGYICKSKETSRLEQKQWVEVTAEVRYEYTREYNGEGPVLYAKQVKDAEPPAEDLVYFN